jgi:hypothetical protein
MTTFQKELNKLENLLGKLNKSNSNNKKNNTNNMKGGKTPDVDVRHFKVVAVDGKKVEDGGRYSLPTMTNPKKGKPKPQRRGPRDQASKAFSELCRGKTGEIKHKITLQETTQGSAKKLFHYNIKRVKLAKPVKVEYKKNGKVIKVVTKKYTNEVKSLGSERPTK